MKRKPVSHFPKDIQTLLSKLRYRNYSITINGSASNVLLKYFGDIDLFSKINAKQTAKEVYDEISDILFKIHHNRNYYFMELKMQFTNDNKIKIFPHEKLKITDIENNFEQLDFIKIDLILFIDSRFVEVSVIYQFSKNTKDFQKSLKEDIEKYLSENNYFKILKRYFSLYSIKQTNKHKLDLLTEFFNSKVGYLYSVYSNLECISALLKEYSDKHTKERIKLNLAELHFNLNNFEEGKKDLFKEINSEAKNFYNAII